MIILPRKSSFLGIALNLAIGCKGEPYKTYDQKAFFSHDKPVTPASLYLAQLRERLGDAAVENIG